MTTAFTKQNKKTEFKRVFMSTFLYSNVSVVTYFVYLIFFRYTEHSTVGLAQQWDQLDQLGMRMVHNLEQQIQARNMSGVSEEALREFSMMFK